MDNGYTHMNIDWNRHDGGWGWDVLDDGRIRLEHGLDAAGDFAYYCELDAQECLRTRGKPLTMGLLHAQHGPAIKATSVRFNVPVTWIAGLIAIEAKRFPDRSCDVISLRDEDGWDFQNYQERPHRVSAGLMQTLLSTARQMARDHDIGIQIDGEPYELGLGDLCRPELSISLGAAYIRHHMDRGVTDPIKLIAAYNAGGVYTSSRHPWRLRVFGATRIPKFVAFHNDMVAVLTSHTQTDDMSSS